MNKVLLKSIVWACALSFPATLVYFAFARTATPLSAKQVDSEAVISKAIETKSKQIEVIEQKAIVANGELLKLQEEKARELEQLKGLRKEIDTILTKHDLKPGEKDEVAPYRAEPLKKGALNDKRLQTGENEAPNTAGNAPIETIDTRLGKMVAIPLPRQNTLDQKTLKNINSFLARGDTEVIYASGLKDRAELLQNVRQHFSKLDVDVQRFEVNELDNEPTLLLKSAVKSHQE